MLSAEQRAEQFKVRELADKIASLEGLPSLGDLSGAEAHVTNPAGAVEKRFTGTWDDRLNGLLECGVDFSGKTVLDVGCNMGIIAYEISKLGPSFIHGIDRSKDHIHIARSIFCGSKVSSRFDVADLGDDTFSNLLLPSYDVVLMLAVYHHLPAHVRPVLLGLLKRCVTAFIFRDPGYLEDEIIRFGAGEGFSATFHSSKPENAGRLTVLSKLSRVSV